LTSERIVFRVLPNRKPVDSESMSCDETMEISKNKSFGDGMLLFRGNDLTPNLAGDVPQEDKNMEEETISLETKYRRRIKFTGREENVQMFRGQNIHETDKPVGRRSENDNIMVDGDIDQIGHLSKQVGYSYCLFCCCLL